jgi:hypothetical protein
MTETRTSHHDAGLHRLLDRAGVYEALTRSRFAQVESAILHDTLRVPYTILVMRCIKSGG